jgi:hypothetical protein
MNVRQRLSRIEAQLKARQRENSADETKWHRDWLSGKTPRPENPSCPSWLDPVAWAIRMRYGNWLTGRADGTLGPDELLPGMTVEEHANFTERRRYVMSGGVLGTPAPL